MDEKNVKRIEMAVKLGLAIGLISEIRNEYADDRMVEDILRIAHNQMVNVRLKLFEQAGAPR